MRLRGRPGSWLPGLCGALFVLAVGGAQAHGPSVETSFSGFRPKHLAIAAGDTVHFRRASGSQLSLSIVSDDGHFESPPLDAAGWHYTFEVPGDFPFHLKENASVRARILVGEPRPEEPEDEHAGHDHSAAPTR